MKKRRRLQKKMERWCRFAWRAVFEQRGIGIPRYDNVREKYRIDAEAEYLKMGCNIIDGKIILPGEIS